MSKLIEDYTGTVTGLMQTIAREEEAAILKAADLLSDKVVEGRLINIFGAGGHSAIAAMEIFWRAGGQRKPQNTLVDLRKKSVLNWRDW